jgi:serine kinase of HPr protein (carbohydrate metabolism regulator)
MAEAATIHAGCVLIGEKAVLITGSSGAGKSSLARELLAAARQRGRFGRLVSDDRTRLEARHGRLIARPVEAISGLIEVRGLGIRRMPHEPLAVVGLVVDLGRPDAERLPGPAQRQAEIEGIALPRLAVAAGTDALPLVLAYLQSAEHVV